MDFGIAFAGRIDGHHYQDDKIRISVKCKGVQLKSARNYFEWHLFAFFRPIERFTHRLEHGLQLVGLADEALG